MMMGLFRRRKALPFWAKWRKDGAVVVDGDKAYPHYLEKLHMEPSQFSLEVARRCFTEDLKVKLETPMHIVIVPNPKWRLENYLEGQPGGADAGAAGFRTYYNRCCRT